MTDNKFRAGRRKLLNTLAAGSGAVLVGKSLPDNWSKPIVDTVILPAHAQTSSLIFAGGAVTNAMLENENPGMLANSLDVMIPTADALTKKRLREWYVCAKVNGGNVDITVAGLNFGDAGEAGIIRQGIIAMDGTPGVIQAIETGSNCSFSELELEANVAIDPSQSNSNQLAVVLFRKESDPFTLLVPVSTLGCPPTPPLFDCGSPSFL